MLIITLPAWAVIIAVYACVAGLGWFGAADDVDRAVDAVMNGDRRKLAYVCAMVVLCVWAMAWCGVESQGNCKPLPIPTSNS